MSQVIFLLVSQCDLMTTFAIVICQKKVRPLVAVALVAPVTPRMCKRMLWRKSSMASCVPR